MNWNNYYGRNTSPIIDVKLACVFHTKYIDTASCEFGLRLK